MHVFNVSGECGDGTGRHASRRFPTLTTAALADRLEQPGVRLIDVRPVEAYNGWRLTGEARSGHVPGAKSLPHKWLHYLDWIEIVHSKDIRPEHDLILYGYDPAEAEAVAGQFRRAGYPSISVYHGLAAEWSTREDLPLVRLPRYRHLVPVAWLKTLFERGTAEEYDGEKFILCHAHYRNPGDDAQGHIPGAVALDTNTLESPETWNRRPPEELQAALERLGITAETTVILYGRHAHPNNDDPFPGSSAGQIAAMRCAFIMLYAGVKDVRVLNGGVQAWLDAGLDLTREATPPQPGNAFGAHIPGRPELAVDTPRAEAMLRDPDANLVSVRSWREFIGEVSGYHYIETKGRIPGAVFGNCGSDAYHMENYRNPDHTTRAFPEIAAQWAALGVTPDKHNAFYCGTGWRGSEAFFNAWLMGWPRVSVYDGGWFEWSRDPARPRETGSPQSPRPQAV